MNRRLAQYQERKAAVASQMNVMLDTLAEQDRDFTDEEKAQYDAYEEEIKRLDAAISREEKIAAAMPGGHVVRSVPGNGQARPDNQRPQFSSLGEMLVAVVRHSASHGVGRVDPRLVWQENQTPGMQAVATGTGLFEGQNDLGGFLVQSDFAQDLLKASYDTGILARRVRRRPIGAGFNGLKMNTVVNTSRATGARYGGIQLYWLDEGGLKTPSRPTFGQFELKLKKLIGLCYATDELLEDAVALEEIIKDAFKEEFGFVIDDAIFRGTGVGMPLGYTVSAAIVRVAAEAGQVAGTIVPENFINMYNALSPRSLANGNAVWVVGPGVIGASMGLQIAGGPAFIPPGGLVNAPFGRILGLPVLPIEQAPPLGTQDDVTLIDLNEYLMIDKRGPVPQGIQIASSIHVRFIYDETCFRFVYRCDGRPIPSAPVTPYQGAQNTSPFVGLAAR